MVFSNVPTLLAKGTSRSIVSLSHKKTPGREAPGATGDGALGAVKEREPQGHQSSQARVTHVLEAGGDHDFFHGASL